jgi:hypothetical protein
MWIRREAWIRIDRFPAVFDAFIIEVDQLLDHQDSLLEAGEEASRFQRLHRLILRTNCIFRRSTVHREGVEQLSSIIRRWGAKLLARLLATAALWVRIQTSFKNTKWTT